MNLMSQGTSDPKLSQEEILKQKALEESAEKKSKEQAPEEAKAIKAEIADMAEQSHEKVEKVVEGVEVPKQLEFQYKTVPPKLVDGLDVYEWKEIGEKNVFPEKSKNITAQVVQSLHDRYLGLEKRFVKLLAVFPKKSEVINKVLGLIKSGEVETDNQKNWQFTVNIRANDAVNGGLKDATYITAQEGLFCFHEGYVRVMARMLFELNENGTNLDEVLDYDKYLNPDNKESAGIKTAWHIENNRKGEIPIEPEPTKKPIKEPEPTKKPIEEPEPTKKPTEEPEPTKKPIEEPEPTKKPIKEPEPTKKPIKEPEPTKKPTEEPVPPVVKTQGEPQKLELVVVDVDEKLERVAERIAVERLDQEMKEIGPQGWRQLWRLDKIAAKWWKRNAAEGYKDKYKKEILKRLRTEPKYRAELMNLNEPGAAKARAEVKPGYWAKWSGKVPEAGPEVSLDADLDAIAERFGISWDAKDKETYLTRNEELDVDTAGSMLVQKELSDLCKEYVVDGSTMTEKDFSDRVKLKILPLIAKTGPKDKDLVAFLQEVTGKDVPLAERRGLLDKLNAHKAGMVKLDMDNFRMALVMGKAQNVDAQTQVKAVGFGDKLGRKLVEWAQNNRFLGRFLSPTTIGIVGYAATNFLANVAGSVTARTAALMTLGLAAPSIAPAIAAVAVASLVAGGMGYFRKNKEVLHSKAQKERRDALNYRPVDDEKGIRDFKGTFEGKMEEAEVLYEKKNVSELMANISSAQEKKDPEALAAALAEAACRNDISAMGVEGDETKTRMDLISFNDEGNIERQRMNLMAAIAQGKQDLKDLCTADSGFDSAILLTDAVTKANNDLVADIGAKDKNFKEFKFRENLRSAAVGAAIGGAFSALTMLASHYIASEVTNPIGKYKGETDLTNVLKSRGVSDADIKAHLQFDPATGKLMNEASTAKWLLDTHHLKMDLQTISQTASVTTMHSITLGTGESKAQLLTLLTGRGVDTTKLVFNADGTLDPASLAYLNGLQLGVTQTATSIVVPGPGVVTPHSLAADGFSIAHRINMNGNDPTGRTHILDELRGAFARKPEVGADGFVHFRMPGVLNPSLAHTPLPAGVSLPGSSSELYAGLQINHGGHFFWKLFKADSNGDLKIPQEYFDASRLGYIARGGHVLPGLRTDALALGFKDQNGVFQILSSADRDTGASLIQKAVSFDIAAQEAVTTPVTTEVIQYDLGEVIPGAGIVVAPIYGDKMKHLESGNAKEEEEQQGGEDEKVEPEPEVAKKEEQVDGKKENVEPEPEVAKKK